MKSIYLSSVANVAGLEDELQQQFCQVLISLKPLDDNHAIPISETKDVTDENPSSRPPHDDDDDYHELNTPGPLEA